MKSVFLKIAAAIMVAGEIARPGEVVEVTLAEARDLLNRGKAQLATEDDMPAVAPTIAQLCQEVIDRNAAPDLPTIAQPTPERAPLPVPEGAGATVAAAADADAKTNRKRKA